MLAYCFREQTNAYNVAGLVYPFMTKYLISSLGFNNAVRAVAGLVATTSLIGWLCAIPNPLHPLTRDEKTSWLQVKRWIDPPAFRNATFNWFCASIAFMFFGFYAIFFNIEEVRSSISSLSGDDADLHLSGQRRRGWGTKIDHQ